MSYQNSIDLLPKELIEQIQQYVDGRVIYIPKKQENKKKWGENTNTKKFLADRNCRICEDYNNGTNIRQLAEKYLFCKGGHPAMITNDEEFSILTKRFFKE